MIEQLEHLCGSCSKRVCERMIEQLARQSRALGESSLGARFVQLIEKIETLVAEYRELPDDVSLEDLCELTARLQAEVEVLKEGIDATPFQELARGVVKIAVGAGEDPKTGSGIVVHLAADRAIVLTATHVVHDGDKVVEAAAVTFSSQPHRSFPAKVLEAEAEDPNGLALLAVEGELPPARCLPLAEVHPEKTQTLYVIGMPRAAETDWTITVGRAAGRKGTKMSLDVPAFSGGNSGGPAVLAGGRVVGMVAAGGAGGFVIAVPSPTLRYALEGWEVEPCGVAGRENREGEPP